MKYEAVVFDLFGTLVENNSFVGNPSDEWRQTLAAIATTVGADVATFANHWGDTWRARAEGVFPTVEACIEQLCVDLGVPANAGQIAAAAALRVDFMRRGLVPRPDAVETLRQVRDAGLRTGLVSNCIPDVPVLWGATAFAELIDVPVFSATAQLAKPDPRIYQLACELLAVTPDRCLFVADGEGGELAGAASIGMDALLIRCSYADPMGHRRTHVEPWDGPWIDWLGEVLPFIEAPTVEPT